MSGPGRLSATYRLQLTPEFGFDAAAGLTAYLADLGVSHLYLSPIFEARPGSTHGYDQTDPTRIRAEFGGESALERLVGAAHEAGLGIVLDIVPNHMAAHHTNPWWFGLLKHGPGSEFDRFFDVDWAGADGRIVLPSLGSPLPEVVGKSELTLDPDAAGGPCVRYFDKLFPLRPDVIIPPGGHKGEGLIQLLARQHYDLCFWRDGLRGINYRRFFDIADLAGLRAEDPAVFQQSHATLFALVARGWIDGVRVDHIDGLRDPRQYLRRLREALDTAAPQGNRVPVFVEKIVAQGEALPASWPVDGMTGYEFLAAAATLMADPTGVATHRDHAAERFGCEEDFRSLATACKREVAESLLGPELSRLCRLVMTGLEAAGSSVEHAALRAALVNISAGMGIYRTYADHEGMTPSDVQRVHAAAKIAAASGPAAEVRLLAEFLTLSGRYSEGPAREHALNAVLAWQQFSGPLAAKGVEDTALYRDVACPALNDVGTEPVETDPVAMLLHVAGQRDERPLSLNATDTHDAKRSEDVRARLAVLTHGPEAWLSTLDVVTSQLGSAMVAGDHRPPTAADLSLIVHSAFALLGEQAPDQALVERLKAYAVKAGREGKQNTSWTSPDAAYENACAGAIELLLKGDALADARARLRALAGATRPTAARLSIASVLLKTLFPGVPDWYQGAECRVLSMVDPDNRRPVDFAGRQTLLADIRSRWSADPRLAAESLLRDPDTDGAKLFASWRALAIRRRLIADGEPIRLESISASTRRWRWVVAAGAQRCEVSVEVSGSPGTSARPILGERMTGVDQLCGRGPDSPALWARVIAEGTTGVW